MDSRFQIALIAMLAGVSYGMIFSYVPIQVQAFKTAIKNSTSIINCANCDFRGVQDLAGVQAPKAHLPGANFQACIPSAANKNNNLMVCKAGQVSNLAGINLAGANMFSVCLDGAILENANLTGVDLSNSSIINASLKHAKVANMVTTNSTFCNSIMPDGKICDDKQSSWTGQGITIQCACTGKEAPVRVSKGS